MSGKIQIKSFTVMVPTKYSTDKNLRRFAFKFSPTSAAKVGNTYPVLVNHLGLETASRHIVGGIISGFDFSCRFRGCGTLW